MCLSMHRYAKLVQVDDSRVPRILRFTLQKKLDENLCIPVTEAFVFKFMLTCSVRDT